MQLRISLVREGRDQICLRVSPADRSLLDRCKVVHPAVAIAGRVIEKGETSDLQIVDDVMQTPRAASPGNRMNPRGNFWVEPASFGEKVGENI